MDEGIKNAVYKVNTSRGSGSGFYLSGRNVFVTNYHVVEGNRHVALEDQQQNRHASRVVYVNPEADIAFLYAENHKPDTGIPFDSVKEVRSRDKVYVLGYPFGMPFTITEGIVSNENQLLDGRNFIQTDAAVNPGNSGGPVVDARGSLIGITASKFTEADNVGFAIPAKILEEELQTFANNTTLIYSLKCSSCKTLIYERVDYCPNCGATIDERIFDEREEGKLAKFVEDAICQMGINPVLTRSGHESWEFHSGSALVRIFVYEKKYLYASSPMNNLPYSNLQPLLEYVLSNPVPPYQLGIFNNQLYLSYRIRISDIYSSGAEEIGKDLSALIVKANDMDDFFVREYGCEKSGYAKLNA